MKRVLPMLGLLGACSGDVPIVGNSMLNRCVDDGDCREGVCDVTTRRCVARARAEVFFRIVPPVSRQGPRDLIATVTAPRALRSGETLDLNVRAWRVVFGTISAPVLGDPRMTLAPVAATVTFTPSNVPDIFPSVESVAQSTLLPAMRGQTQGHTYAVAVSEGLFDVAITPLQQHRGELPPQFFNRFNVRPNIVQQRFDIAYPAEFTRWSGTVRNRSGALVSGLTVVAVDPARNDLKVSTLAITDAGDQAGEFSVAMAIGAPQDWALRVTSNVNERGGLVLQVPRAVCARLDPNGSALDLRLPTDLGLSETATGTAPCVGCVRVVGTVEAGMSTGLTRPLRNVTVTLRTRVPLGDSPLAPESSAWFEDRVQTSGDGTFSAWLIPGDYEVILEPPGEDFANGRASLRVRDDVREQMGQTFTVSPRLTVEGRVLTNAGQPVPGARVRAVPFTTAYVRHACLADPTLAALAPRARGDESGTGVDGSYRLDVDPGIYRIVVEPPSGSGFATDLGDTRCVVSNIRSLDLVLDSPVVVRGVVRDPGGRPLHGAQIEAVARVREVGAMGVSLRVARTTTGSDGTYTLLLPSSAMLSP
jgi:hypothetical protein